MSKLLRRLKENKEIVFNTSLSRPTCELKYKLMLKQHVETGISYLCVTTKDDYIGYSGSGTRWKRLLRKLPSPIFTSLLFVSDDIIEFNNECLRYSELFDVIDNQDFANLIYETGYDYSGISKYHETLTPLELSIRGSSGGNSTRLNGLGIFKESEQHLRSEWAKIGALALNESGNRSGSYNAEWVKNNKEMHRTIASKGGKIGGKITGSKLWWNDGKTNKRSYECPNDGWVRGQLKKFKKESV